jgi:D-lactate dehydrogenase (cytochrome)
MPNTPLIVALQAALGTAALCRDEATLNLFAQDLWGDGGRIACAVTPTGNDDVQKVVRIAAAHCAALITRGGGASYSLATIAADAGDAVILDMRQSDSILEIAPDDLYAVVEAGVTWQALGDALAPHGLRARFRGPLSGRHATVGGSASQNAIFWGSGTSGTMAEAVLGLEVVTGDGTVLSTGTLGIDGAPAFARHFGPDLTGPFLGDGGALGIKTRIALALEPLPHATTHLSFALPSIDALLTVLRTGAREGLCAQQMGMDGRLQRKRMASSGLMTDIVELWRLVRGGPSLLTGLRRAVGVALAGRRFAGDAAFIGHHWIEGGSAAEVAAKSDRLRTVALGAGGASIEASVPRVMDATPFMPLNGITGPAGQRWVPVHGLFAHSRVRAAFSALENVGAARAEAMRAIDVELYYLFTSVGRGATVIEPMLFWPDALSPLHAEFLGKRRMAKLTQYPASAAARALVSELRRELIAAMDVNGAVHMQVGRTYPYRGRIAPGADAFLLQLKRDLDPTGILNPGVLGLHTPGSRPLPATDLAQSE